MVAFKTPLVSSLTTKASLPPADCATPPLTWGSSAALLPPVT
jgi:hypothetical protein